MREHKNVKIYQRIKGVEQQTVAVKVLGISPSQYSQKLNGKYEFTLTEAKKLADYFELTIDQLFFNDELFDLNSK